jgi:hypothetical protein
VQGGNWQISGSGGAWYGYSGGADGGPFMGPDTQNRSQFYQNLLTTPGQSYLLSFYIRGSYPAGQSPPFAMNVYWNSQQVGSYTLNVFSSDWVFESLSVVGGSSSQSVLGFSDPDPTFSAFSDVSVIAIPEPSSFALLGLGAAIALAWVRVESNVAAA